MKRKEAYRELLSKAKQLIDPSVGLVSNMANVSRLIYDTFHFHWCGFYIVNNNRLELGPFCGPIACTSIAFDKGVCGAAYTTGKTKIVANVDEFPGHIACSPFSKSEVVIPCIKDNEVYAVLDIDSDTLDDFSPVDQEYLEQLVQLL